jgi:predicted transcriptional regulator
MDTRELTLHIIKQHIAHGLKHPSPALIKEAIEQAEGIAAGIDAYMKEREAAEKAAHAAAKPAISLSPPKKDPEQPPKP